MSYLGELRSCHLLRRSTDDFERVSIMSCLSEEAGKDVRAGAYRLLRHLIVDQHDVNQLQTRYFDLYLVRCVPPHSLPSLSAHPKLFRRSLSRDHKFEVEKEQALRLVRLLLSLPDTDQPVPSSVIRAITAIAEQTEEKLRLAALQTLGELCTSLSLCSVLGVLVLMDWWLAQ